MTQLFSALIGGQDVRIGRAEQSDMDFLTGHDGQKEIRAVLEGWNIIAIKEGDRRASLHALGWRADLQNVWITSRLTAYDPFLELVCTASNHVYQLGSQDSAEMDLALKAHLKHALLTWGFSDVR